MNVKTNVTVSPSNLTVPTYQRAINDRSLRNIASNFNPAALGAITISKRGDGTLAIIDGRHRNAAALEVGHPELFAIQYEGLTLAEEAALFLELNATRQVTATDKFKASVQAESEHHVLMDAIIRSRGWVVSAGKGRATIAAVVAIEQIFNHDGDGELLANVLDVITTAWPERPSDAVAASMLKGTAKVLTRYGESVKRNTLIDKLRKATPATIIGEANGYKAALNCSADIGVARALVNRYNKSMRTGQIEEWIWTK